MWATKASIVRVEIIEKLLSSGPAVLLASLLFSTSLCSFGVIIVLGIVVTLAVYKASAIGNSCYSNLKYSVYSAG